MRKFLSFLLVFLLAFSSCICSFADVGGGGTAGGGSSGGTGLGGGKMTLYGSANYFGIKFSAIEIVKDKKFSNWHVADSYMDSYIRSSNNGSPEKTPKYSVIVVDDKNYNSSLNNSYFYPGSAFVRGDLLLGNDVSTKAKQLYKTSLEGRIATGSNMVVPASKVGLKDCFPYVKSGRLKSDFSNLNKVTDTIKSEKGNDFATSIATLLEKASNKGFDSVNYINSSVVSNNDGSTKSYLIIYEPVYSCYYNGKICWTSQTDMAMLHSIYDKGDCIKGKYATSFGNSKGHTLPFICAFAASLQLNEASSSFVSTYKGNRDAFAQLAFGDIMTIGSTAGWNKVVESLLTPKYGFNGCGLLYFSGKTVGAVRYYTPNGIDEESGALELKAADVPVEALSDDAFDYVVADDGTVTTIVTLKDIPQKEGCVTLLHSVVGFHSPIDLKKSVDQQACGSKLENINDFINLGTNFLGYADMGVEDAISNVLNEMEPEDNPTGSVASKVVGENSVSINLQTYAAGPQSRRDTKVIQGAVVKVDQSNSVVGKVSPFGNKELEDLRAEVRKIKQLATKNTTETVTNGTVNKGPTSQKSTSIKGKGIVVNGNSISFAVSSKPININISAPSGTPFTYLEGFQDAETINLGMYNSATNEHTSCPFDSVVNSLQLRVIYVPVGVQYNLIDVNYPDGNKETVWEGPLDYTVDNGTASLVQPNGLTPTLIEVGTDDKYTVRESIDYDNPKWPSGLTNKPANTEVNIGDDTPDIYAHWQITVPSPDAAANPIEQWRLSKNFITKDVVIGNTINSSAAWYNYDGKHKARNNYYASFDFQHTGLVIVKDDCAVAYTAAGKDKYSLGIGVGGNQKVEPDVSLNISKGSSLTGKRILTPWCISTLGKYSENVKNQVLTTSSTDISTIQNSDVLSISSKEQYNCDKGFYTQYRTIPSDKGHKHETNNPQYGCNVGEFNYSFAALMKSYKEQPSTPGKVESKITKENGVSRVSYQLSDNAVIKSVPEVLMLSDTITRENNNSSTKKAVVKSEVSNLRTWVNGGTVRPIYPTVAHNMRYDFYDDYQMTPMSYATDTRLMGKAGNLFTALKGSVMNGSYNFKESKNSTKPATLTVRTYVLSADNSKVKGNWGGLSDANNQALHTNFLNKFNFGKVTAEECLKVDGGYVGSTIKSNETYTLKSTTTTPKEHKLEVRGGRLTKVDGKVPDAFKNSSKKEDKDFYNCLVDMGLIATDGKSPVFSGYETKTGDILTDAQGGDKLAGFYTDDDRALGQGWYSEDTTAFVIKEYVSVYNVNSLSVSDKLALQVNGLATPINKAEYFNVVKDGFSAIKLWINSANLTGLNGGNVKGVITSFVNHDPKGDTTAKGYGKPDAAYKVSNVSINDSYQTTSW